jgi:hypothetical protein
VHKDKCAGFGVVLLFSLRVVIEYLRKEEESGRGGVYIASLCLISISSPHGHMSDRVKHEKQSFPCFYCREIGELVAAHRESRPGLRSAHINAYVFFFRNKSNLSSHQFVLRRFLIGTRNVQACYRSYDSFLLRIVIGWCREEM